MAVRTPPETTVEPSEGQPSTVEPAGEPPPPAPRRRRSRRRLARLGSLERTTDSIAATLSYARVRHRLHYRVEGIPLAERYDAFVVAAFPIAMRRARKLQVPGEVSPRLLQALPTAQEILRAWVPPLRRTRVWATPGAPPAPANGRGTAAFFTAGVDSFYTVVRNRDRLDALIFVHGFDVPLEDTAQRRRISDGVARAAEALGLPLIEVETNLRAAAIGNLGWGFYHGAALASVAHVLGERFNRVLIPATTSWHNLYPWGSHPVLDPLWSTEAVELVHEGNATRTEKLAELARSDVAMETLRVCYQKGSHYNCGRCRKCLQTMAGLRLVGALDRCATFPDGLSLRALRRVEIPSEASGTYLSEHLAVAERLGSDPELTRAIRAAIRGGRRRGARRRRYKLARRSLKARAKRLRRTLGSLAPRAARD